VKKASATTSRHIIDDLVKGFSKIQLSNMIGYHEYESRSYPTSTPTRIGLLELDSNPSSNHPTQIPFKSATVYQEATQPRFQFALQQLLRPGEEFATSRREVGTSSDYYLDSNDEMPLSSSQQGLVITSTPKADLSTGRA
jgi:hypothetical protein